MGQEAMHKVVAQRAMVSLAEVDRVAVKVVVWAAAQGVAVLVAWADRLQAQGPWRAVVRPVATAGLAVRVVVVAAVDRALAAQIAPWAELLLV
jgi:hypothetical protein